MTLRLAMVIDGDGSGAQKAIEGTAAGVTRLAATTKTAAGAASEMSAATQREEAALTAVTATTRANTAAMQANVSVNRQAAAQRANLVFQLNDIFVSLASGMNPAMVAIQQGSQISSIYGPGGLGKALAETGNIAKSLVTKFWPVALAVGVVTAAIAGMTYSINQAGGAQVSFGDVALGVLQTFGDYIVSFIKPAIDAIGGWFRDNWTIVVALTKNAVNSIIRPVVGFVEITKYLVSLLPPTFAIGAQGMAKAFLGPVQFMVDQTIGGINTIIDGLNSVGANIKPIDPFTIVADFGADKAFQDIVAKSEAYQKKMAEISVTDYAGGFFNDVAGHAQANAADKKKDPKPAKASEYDQEIKSIRERTAALGVETNVIGLSTFAAERLRKTMELENAARKDAIGLTPARVAEIQKEATAYAQMAATLEQTSQLYDFGKQAFNSFFSDLKTNLMSGTSAWQSFADAGLNALSKIGDKVLEMSVNGLFDTLFGAVSGVLKGVTGGGILGGLLGGTGSVASIGASLIGSNANGTNDWRGGLTWVGERGPELLNVPGGSQIFSNPQSMAMAGAAGGSGSGSGQGTAPPLQVNIIGAPSQPQVQRNGSGGIDVIFAEVDRRLSNGTMGKGLAQRYGLSRPGRRT